MMGIKRGSAAAYAVVGAMAMLAPAAAHAGTWLSPIPANSSTGFEPSVALDATGNTVVAWRADPPGLAAAAQGAHHLVGGTGFTQLPDFSTDTTVGHFNTDPIVVTNRSGNGLVVWINNLGGGLFQIQLRTISPGGTVGPVVTVPSGAPVPSAISKPSAAIDANGDAVVAWVQGTGIQAITRQGLTGTFTNLASPDQLVPAASSTPTVAIDKDGNSIVAWQAGNHLEAKRHPAGGSWTALPDAAGTGGHTYSGLALAANPTGQMLVAFEDFDGTNTVISSVTGTVSGGWGATPTVTPLSPPGVTQRPGVSVDDGGGAAVGWAAGAAVKVSLRPAGGTFPAPGAVQSVTTVPSAPDNFFLSGSGTGAVVVAWSTFEGAPTNQNVVRAAVKPAGTSTFTPTQIISDKSTYAALPSIALDENGDAVVAYQLGATPAGIGTAVFDGAGPLLGTPTVPASAVQGTSASFSVAQPLDAFSAVASVNWSFGDGSADATGTQVSHKFGSAGTFKVTVTATDGVGNTNSTSRNITVTGGSSGTKCVVPKLKGKSLSKAKGLLKAAHCKLGKVTKPKPRKRHKLGKLVVKSSSPKAGSKRPAGTKVSLKLGPAPKKHKQK
jgi:hypothetical protein